MSLIYQDRAKVLLSKIYRLKPFSSNLPYWSCVDLIKIHNRYLTHKRMSTRDFNELDSIYNYLCVLNRKHI